MELTRATSAGGLQGELLSGRAEKYMSCAVPPARSDAHAMSRSSSSVAGAMSLAALLRSVTSVGGGQVLVRRAREEPQLVFPFLLPGRALQIPQRSPSS